MRGLEPAPYGFHFARAVIGYHEAHDRWWNPAGGETARYAFCKCLYAGSRIDGFLKAFLVESGFHFNSGYDRFNEKATYSSPKVEFWVVFSIKDYIKLIPRLIGLRVGIYDLTGSYGNVFRQMTLKKFSNESFSRRAFV